MTNELQPYRSTQTVQVTDDAPPKTALERFIESCEKPKTQPAKPSTPSLFGVLGKAYEASKIESYTASNVRIYEAKQREIQAQAAVIQTELKSRIAINRTSTELVKSQIELRLWQQLSSAGTGDEIRDILEQSQSLLQVLGIKAPQSLPSPTSAVPTISDSRKRQMRDAILAWSEDHDTRDPDEVIRHWTPILRERVDARFADEIISEAIQQLNDGEGPPFLRNGVGYISRY